jgi:prolyl 4-hydroxylase
VRRRERGARFGQNAQWSGLKNKNGRSTPFPHTISEHAFEKQHKQSDGAVWVEHLSWEPRASLLHNFLTPAECDHLWALAKPYMARSTVVDNVSGERQPSKVRTSSGMFLQRGQDDVVKTIEDRIARFTAIPVENGEGLQVLNYQEGELYGE